MLLRHQEDKDSELVIVSFKKKFIDDLDKSHFYWWGIKLNGSA